MPIIAFAVSRLLRSPYSGALCRKICLLSPFNTSHHSSNHQSYTSHRSHFESCQTAAMEALLRQSRSMCPFLSKTSPATLRSLSTTTRHVSPGGGTMSNLQLLARRCPIMGKAMAVQGAKGGIPSLGGVFGGARAYGGRAKLHTTRPHKATVDTGVLGHREHGLLA